LREVDTLVIGSGFGGLSTALTLSEQGVDVLLVEALKYPGGCASTFTKQGYAFETGATLFSGFGPGQLMRGWIERYGLDVQVQMLNPIVELRAPDLTLAIPSERAQLVSRIAEQAGEKAPGVRDFFREQKQVADALWELFDDPAMLPPFGLKQALVHAGRSARYLPLLRLSGRPVQAALERHGVDQVRALRTYLDAVCQITVQAPASQAEAPFAMGAMDYYFRGTGHVQGGIGSLAWGLVSAIEENGAQVQMSTRAKSLRRDERGWIAELRGETVRARRVVANLLPQAVMALTETQTPELRALGERVEQGWGAVMLYLAIDGGALERQDPHHLELVQDPDAPYVDGNHLFCSVSGAGEDPSGHRTVTVSTHTELAPLRAMSQKEQERRIAAIQAKMEQGLRALAPELVAERLATFPASPRTWERFTRRPGGFVGGIPRTVGLHNDQGMIPGPVLPGLYLVGDTVFPGQSTLATALGGVKLGAWLASRRAS
jgi:phytoene dehydrogenase-like protein